jgi:hypothetical protein
MYIFKDPQDFDLVGRTEETVVFQTASSCPTGGTDFALQSGYIEAQVGGCGKVGYKTYFKHLSGGNFEINSEVEKFVAPTGTGMGTWAPVECTKATEDIFGALDNCYMGAVVPLTYASGDKFRLRVEIPAPATVAEGANLVENQTYIWFE